MKNSTYWANRFKALEDRQYRKSAAFVEGLKAKFDYADDELETSLYKWYSKLMKNTDAPSLNDAKKLLKENELKEFHWTLEQYEKYAKEHGLDPEWIKKLENASARKHISRYEQIQLQMRQIEEKLYAEYNNECYGYLGELVEDSYYHTAYEIEKGTGIGIDLHKLDRDTVEKYLTHPWCQDGKVFSDRIWQRKDELVRTLDQELTRQLITGADPQKAIDAISDKFDVSKRQAGTLVMTESAAIASEASKDSMENLGVEEYEVLATLDSHTSEICQEMDGQHFRMSEYNPGLTAPPFHPNCRSTTIPYFDDELTIGETRAARDKNDKDYERVPADMKYGEWKKKYINGKEPDAIEYTPEQVESYRKRLTDIDNQIAELRKQEEGITGYKHGEYLEYLKKNGSTVEKEFEGYEDEKKQYYEIQNQIKNLEEQRSNIPDEVSTIISKEDIEKTSKGDIIEVEDKGSEAFISVKQSLEKEKVTYLDVGKLEKELTDEEIIEKVAGGDMTDGSCASAAYAYIGNKSGYDVRDFKGGVSRSFFSQASIHMKINDIPGIKGEVIMVKQEAKDVAGILKGIKPNKEYFLSTGKHAAIVRKFSNGLEYLELQSPKSNGWKSFTNMTFGSLNDTLNKRFGCRKTVDRQFGRVWEKRVILTEVDSFKDNEEFRKLLGYINTEAEKKGIKGSIK